MMRRRPASRRPRYAALCGLSLLCGWPASHASAEGGRWAPLGPVWVTSWPPPPGPASPSEAVPGAVVPAGPLSLDADRVAVVRVRHGEMVDAGDPEVLLGLGFGDGVLPDAIVWQQAPGPLQVPSASAARFVVARGRRGAVAALSLRYRSQRAGSLPWYRHAQALAGWLARGLRGPVPSPPDAESARLLRRLLSTRDALQPRTRRKAPKALGALLWTRWQRDAAQLRPHGAPYFERVPLRFAGDAAPGEAHGAPPVADDPEENPEAIATVEPNATLALDTEPEASLTLFIRSQRPGSARAMLYAGEVLASVYTRDAGPSPDGDAWTGWTRVRLALPPNTHTARVVAMAGRVQVRASARRARPAMEAGGRAVAGYVSGLFSQAEDPPPTLQALRSLGRHPVGPARATAYGLLDAPSLADGERAVLALALAESSPPGPDLKQLAAVAWRASAGLPTAARLPLRRALLERLWDLSTAWPAGPWTLETTPVPAPNAEAAEAADVDGIDGVAGSGSGGLAEDATAIDALTVLLSAPTQSREPSVVERPAATAARTTREARNGGDLTLHGLARALWQKRVSYRALSPATPRAPRYSAEAPLDQRDRPERCAVAHGDGYHWTRLSGDTQIVVAHAGGSHTLIPLRADPTLPPAESLLRVDGEPVVVHGSVGLGTRIALRPGPHRFEVTGAPVLARIPRQGFTACDVLRSLQAHYDIDGPIEFALPPQAWPTPVRLELSPVRIEATADGFRRVTLSAGAGHHEAWLLGDRPASVDLVAPIGSTGVRIESAGQMRVEASARLPTPPRQPASIERRAPEALTDAGVAAGLQALRRTTRALRATGDPDARSRLRDERSRLLAGLGQTSLADLDRRRAALPDLDALDPIDPDAPTALAVDLPDHAPALVPQDTRGQIPVLPTPQPDAWLSEARALLAVRADRARLAAELPARLAGAPLDAGTLLEAELSGRAGLHGRAAEAFVQLSRVPGGGAAFGPAARHLLARAEETGDTSSLMRALSLSLKARDAGAHVSGTLSRLFDRIRWESLDAVDAAAGRAALERVADAGASTIGQAVRAALLDLPEGARNVSDGQRVTLRTAEAIRLELLCHALRGDDERCLPDVRVDGLPLACGQRDPEDQPVAHPVSCALPAANHERTVEVGFADGIGWLRSLDKRGRPIPWRSISRWQVAEAGQPVRMTLAGPTVVRLSMRAAGDPAVVRVRTRSLGASDGAATDDPAETAWQALPERDPDAHLVDTPGAEEVPVTQEVTQELAIEEGRVVTLELEPVSGRALLRAQVAMPRDPPTEGVPVEGAPARVPELREESVALPALPPLSPIALSAWQPPRDPGLVDASLAAAAGDSGQDDEDRGRRHLTLTLSYRRAAIAERLWVSASVLGSHRDQHDSGGAATAVDYLPSGPGGVELLGRARVISQSTDTRVATGATASARLRWLWQPTAALRVRPYVTAAFRSVDGAARDQLDAAPEVYTPWAATHPRTLHLGVVARHRLWSDSLLAYTTETTATPTGELDRVDLGLSLDSMPGPAPVPWLTLGTDLSYRRAGPSRQQPYLRSSVRARARLWHQPTPDGRVMLSATVRQRWDTPSTAGGKPVLAGLLVLSYTHGLSAGLAAQPPRNRVFRAFQEQSAGLVLDRRGARYRQQDAP